jgi:hypothetical protein
MIYSRYTQVHHYQWKEIKPLSDCKFEEDDVFYHHHYNELFHNVHLQDCLNEEHWQHLITNRSVKLVHENAGETFTKEFASDIVEVVNKGIAPSQIYIIVMDDLHRRFLRRHLKVLGIEGVHIGVHNHLQKNVKFPELLTDTNYKFSSLSRNYKVWRLKLYSKLLESNALENFVYSFYNIHAYEKTEFPVDVMRKDLVDANIAITPRLAKWLEECPHTLDAKDNVANKWSDVTYDTIQNADLHLIVETHFDYAYYTKQVIGGERQAPSFITEKVYKAIACKKPFLMFATPFMLEDLRSMGFKTFGPYINEEYDYVEDNDKRIELLVGEIERINNLSQDEYIELLQGCESIAQENLNKLKQIKENKIVNRNFLFSKELVKDGLTFDDTAIL